MLLYFVNNNSILAQTTKGFLNIQFAVESFLIDSQVNIKLVSTKVNFESLKVLMTAVLQLLIKN